MEQQEKNEETGKVLKELVEEMISKMGFACEVEVSREEREGQEAFLLDVKTNESSFLIGQHGMNLQALQHVSRLLARKKIDERISFVLDINSYRSEKNVSIIKLANSLASQALSEKRPVIMRPMSSYERRVVHMELAKNDLIKTESIGEGEERRIVIKPAAII